MARVIPLAGLQRAGLRDAPHPARRPPPWGLAAGRRASLLFGAFAVVALWACFWADYHDARDSYFTIAMGHVLAEVPFLLRLL